MLAFSASHLLPVSPWQNLCRAFLNRLCLLLGTIHNRRGAREGAQGRRSLALPPLEKLYPLCGANGLTAFFPPAIGTISQ
jgi:hypothetical protein